MDLYVDNPALRYVYAGLSMFTSEVFICLSRKNLDAFALRTHPLDEVNLYLSEAKKGKMKMNLLTTNHYLKKR